MDAAAIAGVPGEELPRQWRTWGQQRSCRVEEDEGGRVSIEGLTPELLVHAMDGLEQVVPLLLILRDTGNNKQVHLWHCCLVDQQALASAA